MHHICSHASAAGEEFITTGRKRVVRCFAMPEKFRESWIVVPPDLTCFLHVSTRALRAVRRFCFAGISFPCQVYLPPA